MENYKIAENAKIETKENIKKLKEELNTIVAPECRKYLLTLICLNKNMYKFHTACSLYFRKSISRDVLIHKFKEVKIEYRNITGDFMELSMESCRDIEISEGMYLKICNQFKKDYEAIEELEKNI